MTYRCGWSAQLAYVSGTAALLCGLMLVLGGNALAQAPNPLTTNIPYVAWRGEQVKLVECAPAVANAVDSDVLVEEWSGSADSRPQVASGSDRSLFTNAAGVPCIGIDVMSLGDGLARVKLVATNANGDPILTHQFLAIWLSIGAVAIDEIGAGDRTGGPPGSLNEVGDPAGDGALTAGSRFGRVSATVTGTFPHPLGPGGRFTLPSGWAALANALAADNNANPDDDAARWDIHDDQLPSEGHVGAFCAAGPPATTGIDAVDNCRGPNAGASADQGPFSRVFGDSAFPAIGPFDPVRPGMTLLSDGKLDAGDAPMPAVRLDFRIAANSGQPHDISGVGALVAADKSVYSRDGNGSTSVHNLYAPFYRQWIPPTATGPASSGVDGPAAGSNFTGFLFSGEYDNWQFASVLRAAVPAATTCNRFVAFAGGRTADTARTTPAGPQAAAVYTDEHGEAQVWLNPNTGFYFDSLASVPNDNRGCDLQPVRTLGTASITAVARYPYQPVSDPPRASATLTKAVGNLFNKSLSYYPKGPGEANDSARVVVAHGNDINGAPFAGERVCFYLDDEADGSRPFQGTTGPQGARFTVNGAAETDLAHNLGADQCAKLDANGNAAIEVLNGDREVIDVITEYVDEGLLRTIDVRFTKPGTSGGNPPPAPLPTRPLPPQPGTASARTAEPAPAPAAAPTAAPTSVSDAGTAPPSATLVAQTAGPQIAAKIRSRQAKPKTTASISTAKIVRIGKPRYLVVRVNSASPRERIRIRMLDRGGQTLRIARARIATNKPVRVLKLARDVAKVKVSLVG